MVSKFKNSSGVWLTRALFIENAHKCAEGDTYAIFSLKNEDFEKDGTIYPSLYKLYMSYNDPTEYSFANEVLGGWEHWQKILVSKEIRDLVDRWREEMEIKLMSQAISAMRETALNEGSKGTSAARYLAERGWQKKAGRPTKEQIAREARIQAGLETEIAEDAERIRPH